MIEFELPRGPLTVLCLAAHPDDIEIGCGGTLLGLRTRGQVQGHWLTLTGSTERVVEATKAAGSFLPGAECTFHTFPDGRLPAHWTAVKDALHQAERDQPRPDIVLAPRPDDAHQDHRLLGELAPTVWRSSLVWHYEIPKWDGDFGSPNAYVSIPADRAQEKVRLLHESYPSQTSKDWWDSEMFLGLMRLRGMECRSTFAEGFYLNKLAVDIDGDSNPRS